MMELLRQWLMGITGAALLAALAESMMPSGAVRRVGKLAGGLLLLLAVLQPLLTTGDLASAIVTVKDQALFTESRKNGEEANLEAMKTIIAQKTGAYILDKAAGVGAACQKVTVTCAVGQNQVPYPSAVTLVGSFTSEQRRQLTRILETELAITAEHQSYESGGDT